MLTCVCMLRYSAHYAVPMLFYFFSFSVVRFWQSTCILQYSARYAVPMLFYFFTFSVIHFWQGVCILRYSARYAMPILFHFFTFSVIHFRQGVCILRYSVRYALRSLALNLRRGGAACHHQQPASPRRPFTNRSSTATITSQPSSAAPMAQNLPSSHPISHNQAATLSQPHSHHPIQLQNILSINPRPLINHQRPFNLDPGIPALTGLDQHHIRLLINKRIHQLHPLRL